MEIPQLLETPVIINSVNEIPASNLEVFDVQKWNSIDFIKGNNRYIYFRLF